MRIFCLADLPQEEAQIFLLRETGELRRVVQSYVDQSLDPRLPQDTEELLC